MLKMSSGSSPLGYKIVVSNLVAYFVPSVVASVVATVVAWV